MADGRDGDLSGRSGAGAWLALGAAAIALAAVIFPGVAIRLAETLAPLDRDAAKVLALATVVLFAAAVVARSVAGLHRSRGIERRVWMVADVLAGLAVVGSWMFLVMALGMWTRAWWLPTTLTVAMALLTAAVAKRDLDRLGSSAG